MNADPRVAAPVLAGQLVPKNDVAIRRVAADSLLRLITVADYLKEQALHGTPISADKQDVLIADAEVARYAPTGLSDSDAGVRERLRGSHACRGARVDGHPAAADLAAGARQETHADPRLRGC